MSVQRANHDELAKRIDEIWDSYKTSFPEDAQREKIEMMERLKPKEEKGFRREIFYSISENQQIQAIGIYHVNKFFPFCYGEYIWTRSDAQSKLNGTNIHYACIDYLKDQGVNDFICEGHEDNPWHRKIGLGLIPVDYLQPAISSSQEDVYMNLLYDVNLGGNVLKSQDLLSIMSHIFFGIYETQFHNTKYEDIMKNSICGKRKLIIEI